MEQTNTIVIADDSEMIAKALGFMIKKAGYTVLSADDGKNALNFFDERNIDLLITDLNMPNMDGIELIRKIRSKESYHYMPVLLFVADDDTQRKELIETSGATMLFDKKDINGKILPTIKSILSLWNCCT